MRGMKGVWNDARDELLRQLVKEGISRAACVAPLAGLAGPAITKAQQIADRMFALGLRYTPQKRRDNQAAGARMRPTFCWSAERQDYLRQAYPANRPGEEIMAELAKLPGPPIASWGAVVHQANTLGLRRPPPARDRERQRERRHLAAKAARARRGEATAAEAKPKKAPRAVKQALTDPIARPLPAALIRPTPAQADAAVTSRYAQARAALAKKGHDAHAIARVHGLPLREVYRLAGEIRRAQAVA